MKKKVRLKDEEALYLGLQLKEKHPETEGNPRYRLTKEQENLILNYRTQTTQFTTIKKTLDADGNVRFTTEKLIQKTPVDIPENHEIIRLSTNISGNQQWVITQPKKEPEVEPEELLKLLTENIRPFEIERTEGTGTGVYFLSDFHMGAYVGKLIKTPDFNFGIIENYFREIAELINNQKHEKVYIGLLGDFIESFTGLNHRDSWKGLHKNADGVKAIILAHEILRKNIYTKINNLEWVGFISGNHDRTSEITEGDQFGGVAEMLQYLCSLEFEFKSEWNPILISKEIDGINYIMTHGHLGISKIEISQIVFQYGKQGLYNVFVKGHKHSREQKKTYEKKVIFEKSDAISYDTADYRAVTAPPLFTGNFYSESNGWTSQAGFIYFENNGRGKVKYIDYTI